MFSSVDCNVEYSSNSVQQACDALATAAVLTVTVYYDNSQATRLQFSSTSGLQRDQLQSSSQDNENCCVQFSSLWAATVEYSTLVDQLHVAFSDICP